MGTSDLQPDHTPAGPREAAVHELYRVGDHLAEIARATAPPPQPPDPAQAEIARRRAEFIAAQERGPMWTDDNPGEVGK